MSLLFHLINHKIVAKNLKHLTVSKEKYEEGKNLETENTFSWYNGNWVGIVFCPGVSNPSFFPDQATSLPFHYKSDAGHSWVKKLCSGLTWFCSTNSHQPHNFPGHTAVLGEDGEPWDQQAQGPVPTVRVLLPPRGPFPPLRVEDEYAASNHWSQATKALKESFAGAPTSRIYSALLASWRLWNLRAASGEQIAGEGSGRIHTRGVLSYTNMRILSA